MHNLEGKMITSTNNTKYLLTDIAGQGAQGIVYNEASGKYIIKLYKNGSPIQNNNKLKKLNWLLQQNYPDQFIKPLDIFDKPFIGYVMKNVTGHISLNKLLIPAKQMSFSKWYNDYSGGLRRRLFLAYKVAMQFSMLHNTNRAYCDISGNNILVNENISIASVCMIDIDNIYIPGGDSGNVLGTSRYMAPEIMNKKMLPDIFTDDYSLAVILFELLRGGHPYIGDMVEDGTPEQQTEAYLGMYPYVDDEEIEFNRSSQMLPSEVVFTDNLKQLFSKTFIKGKENRVERTMASEFALACFEASNKVMKCSKCGNWHYAISDPKKEFICPWCDEKNEKPKYISFRDSYYIKEKDEKIVKRDKIVHSFVLRDDKNDITDNYISNFYIKRDKFAKPIGKYFTVRKAKDGKFYLINSSNQELYINKANSNKNFKIASDDDPFEIGYKDKLFFSNPIDLKEGEIYRNYEGILFRYAIVL